MTDLDIRAIRQALATDAADARYVKRALSYLPDKITVRDLPLVVVGNPDGVAYNRKFGAGHATVTLPVTALIAENTDPARAAELLDSFASQTASTSAAPESLALALRQPASTSQRPWTVNVSGDPTYGLFQFESAQYLGVQLTVVVST